MSSVVWSDWLDFNKDTIESVPESAGIFMMHSAMKILFIGNTLNLRSSLIDSLHIPCTSNATRFRYTITDNHLEITKGLIKDYKKRHEGNLPKCMNEK